MFEGRVSFLGMVSASGVRPADCKSSLGRRLQFWWEFKSLGVWPVLRVWILIWGVVILLGQSYIFGCWTSV